MLQERVSSTTYTHLCVLQKSPLVVLGSRCHPLVACFHAGEASITAKNAKSWEEAIEEEKEDEQEEEEDAACAPQTTAEAAAGKHPLYDYFRCRA
jgi:hypothetical protein